MGLIDHFDLLNLLKEHPRHETYPQKFHIQDHCKAHQAQPIHIQDCKKWKLVWHWERGHVHPPTQMEIPEISWNIYTGWWYTYPSEKYYIVRWNYCSQLNGKIIQPCSKPPTSYIWWHGGSHNRSYSGVSFATDFWRRLIQVPSLRRRRLRCDVRWNLWELQPSKIWGCNW